MNGYTFIPIKYLIRYNIQTPKLFIPFNVSVFNNKRYLDLSFQNIKNDKNIELLEENLKLLDEKVKESTKKYKIIPFFRNFNNNHIIRFKILNNTLFFDQNKNQIKTIENLTYGSFIIHLNGLWLIDDKLILIGYYCKVNRYAIIFESLCIYR